MIREELIDAAIGHFLESRIPDAGGLSQPEGTWRLKFSYSPPERKREQIVWAQQAINRGNRSAA